METITRGLRRNYSFSNTKLNQVEDKGNGHGRGHDWRWRRAAQLAEEKVGGDEKFAQIITMVHSRGIATGLELAATEIWKEQDD